jgi:hypothetical protein
MKWLMTMIALLGMAAASAPLFGDQTVAPAQPGAVNYVEGKVLLDGRQLTADSVGSDAMYAGQVLSTQQGRAEILLTPGVFLRVGHDSAVKMISPALTPTEVEVEHGLAAIEVDEIHKENLLLVTTAGVTTRLTKTGYYEFNADHPSLKVFKGEAEVDEGNGRHKKIKGSHQVALVPDAALRSVKFDTNQSEDALYRWSSLRSRYLAEANQQIAGEYAGVDGFAPGWYWDPYGFGYTFIGADPFFSPFGWNFYPPWWGGFYGGGWAPRRYTGHFRDFDGPAEERFEHHGFRGGEAHHGGEGFHGGAGMRGGGGRHEGHH